MPIVHDTFAHGLPSTVSTINARHPLESRVKNWNSQQDALKMEMAKRLGGIGEVIRIGTERMIVGEVNKSNPIPPFSPRFHYVQGEKILMCVRIFDLLHWVDHRIYMLILLLDGIQRLTWMMFTMVWVNYFETDFIDYDLANVPFHTEIEKRLRI